MYLSLGGNLVTTLSRQLPCQSLRGRMRALEADKGYDAAWLASNLIKRRDSTCDSLSENQKQVCARL